MLVFLVFYWFQDKGSGVLINYNGVFRPAIEIQTRQALLLFHFNLLFVLWFLRGFAFICQACKRYSVIGWLPMHVTCWWPRIAFGRLICRGHDDLVVHAPLGCQLAFIDVTLDFIFVSVE